MISLKQICFILVTVVCIAACSKPKTDPVSTPVYSGKKAVPEPRRTDTPALRQQTIVYLSFDDGPQQGSRQVNELAFSDSVKIDVFLIGRFVFKSDSSQQLFHLYRNNPFVEAANHSFTHANKHYRLYYKDADQVKADFLLNQDTLLLDKKIARLPGRNCWRINGRSRNDLEDGEAAADSLAANGYKVFGWDIEWRYDSTGRMTEDAAAMLNKIKRMAERKSSFTPGNIVILCHDPVMGNPYNQAELRLFVNRLKADSHFRFEHLSRYPG